MSDLPYRVEKPWGYELIWAKTDRYVGKILHIEPGHVLSLQYHNKKDETIYVQSGRMMFEIGPKGGPLEKCEMRPGDSTYFAQRYTEFEQKLKQADQQWMAQMKPYAGRKIVTYHRSWPNFAGHFGLNVVGYVEPRPGIPPSPQHTVELIGQMKRDGVKIIVVEPYFDLKTPNAIARDTGGTVVVLMPSVGGEKEITDYFKLFDYDIAKLKQAFDSTH